MGRTPRAAAAALIRERAPVILPRVVADAAAGDASEQDSLDLQRRLTTFLERRIPPWVEALEADNGQRRDAIGRLLQTDAAAAEHIPPVVLLGTVAIGYRVIETEIRAKADAYGYSPNELWAEVDLLRRTVGDMRRGASDGGRVA
ncbi:MAG: hypothetical protein M3O99_10585 [Chloroflexota bacterium]|nr:hypothetical protein [Chloroflexota bacterium]